MRVQGDGQQGMGLKARRLTLNGGLVALLFAAGACESKPAAEGVVADLTKAVYAAPGGWSGGEGTQEQPFDLGTALSAKSPVRPGGTVWLRGGTYRGSFTNGLTGTAEAPITVRPIPGEAVVLDGATSAEPVLIVNGAWTVFRDFEVTNSDPRRLNPKVNRGGGVEVHGPNTKVINLVLHDTGGGIGMWSDAVDAEAYGNIIYYNGWMGADRPHGHGIYTQNKTGTRRINDNVIFRQFGAGIHAYGSEEAYLDSIEVEGNVLFNNGMAGGDFDILFGGGRIAKRPVFKANYTYDEPGAGAGNNLGYDTGCEGLLMKDNYFGAVKAGYAVQFVNCAGAVEDNVLVGIVRGIERGTIVGHSEVTTKYPKNQFNLEPPTGQKVFVRPNRFQPGRAHVVVYNWDLAKQVRVDLGPVGIAPGSPFEIRDVQNLMDPPVVSGTYSGAPVMIPIGATTVAPVVGWQATPKHTGAGFAVFLVTSSDEKPSAGSRLVASLRRMVGM